MRGNLKRTNILKNCSHYPKNSKHTANYKFQQIESLNASVMLKCNSFSQKTCQGAIRNQKSKRGIGILGLTFCAENPPAQKYQKKKNRIKIFELLSSMQQLQKMFREITIFRGQRRRALERERREREESRELGFRVNELFLEGKALDRKLHLYMFETRSHTARHIFIGCDFSLY